MANNPYVNKVQYGNQTLLDLTSDTIVANKLANGKTAHDASGNQITGTYDFATATAANAIADDVTEGKTGWANGVQIIGTKKGIPTWADGTDEEIAEALEKHYAGEINIHDYWTVGDERVVRLGYMNAYSPLTDTHESQDVVFVLLHKGGFQLVAGGECAFVVGQKNCLESAGKLSGSDNTKGWKSQDRYKWCNQTGSNFYRGAFPSTFLSIFKQHYYYEMQSYNNIQPRETGSLFRFPSIKEVTGNDYNNDKTSSYYPHLEYYKTSSNRIKKYISATSIPPTEYATNYWTSSKRYYNGSSTGYQKQFFYITSNGSYDFNAVTASSGLAPQGVI